MGKGPPLFLLIPVLLWIGYDVASGGLQGVQRVNQQRLDETPFSEILSATAKTYREKIGEAWTEHATIKKVYSTGNKLSFRLRVTDAVEQKVGKTVKKYKIVGIRHDILDQVCRHKDLKYILSRDGTVTFDAFDSNGRSIVTGKAGPTYC